MGGKLMPVFHLNYKLADFDKWITMFKESELRKKIEVKHGVKAIRVLHDAHDQNHAITVLKAEDRASIDQFISEPEVQERFADRSLFVESPQITGGYEGTYLESFEEGENPAFQVDHQLTDYNRWFEAWSSNRAERTALWEKHGCKPIRLLRDIENGNHVIIVVMAPNAASVEDLLAEAKAQERFADREVFQQPPQIRGQYTIIPV